MGSKLVTVESRRITTEDSHMLFVVVVAGIRSRLTAAVKISHMARLPPPPKRCSDVCGMVGLFVATG